MRKREKVEIMIREAIPADAKDIIAFSRKDWRRNAVFGIWG